MRRRISRPRVHRPWLASLNSSASSVANSRWHQSYRRDPFVPSPAKRRCNPLAVCLWQFPPPRRPAAPIAATHQKSPAASARIHPALRGSPPSSPSRNGPAFPAVRACANNGPTRALTSLRGEAKSSGVVSIDAKPSHETGIMVAHRSRTHAASQEKITTVTLAVAFWLQAQPACRAPPSQRDTLPPHSLCVF